MESGLVGGDGSPSQGTVVAVDKAADQLESNSSCMHDLIDEGALTYILLQFSRYYVVNDCQIV